MVYTQIKTATVLFRFEMDEETGEMKYPKTPAYCELKSTTIPPKLIAMLSKKLDAHMKELSKEGKPHVLAGY